MGNTVDARIRTDVEHSYTNVGAGIEWAINDEYSLSSSVMTMSHGEQVHKMDYTITIGLSWSF